MDRDRLKEVHTTDLTEARVNEDMVDWLKTKGPSWLLVILIAMCVFVAAVRWRQHKTTSTNAAWGEYYAAQFELPSRLEAVADQYGDVDQLANLARLDAARMLFGTIQSGKDLSARVPIVEDPANPIDTPDAPIATPLTEETREKNLARAEGLYDQVLASDDDSAALTLHIVSAMGGKAAIAESRGDAETAAQWYRKAAERAGERYPGLAEQALARAESVADHVSSGPFPAEPSTAGQTRITPVKRDELQIDPALAELILPEE